MDLTLTLNVALRAATRRGNQACSRMRRCRAQAARAAAQHQRPGVGSGTGLVSDTLSIKVLSTPPLARFPLV